MVIQGLPAAAERLSDLQVLDAEALNAARLPSLDDLPHWSTRLPIWRNVRVFRNACTLCSVQALPVAICVPDLFSAAICRPGHQTPARATSAIRSLVRGLLLRPGA